MLRAGPPFKFRLTTTRTSHLSFVFELCNHFPGGGGEEKASPLVFFLPPVGDSLEACINYLGDYASPSIVNSTLEEVQKPHIGEGKSQPLISNPLPDHGFFSFSLSPLWAYKGSFDLYETYAHLLINGTAWHHITCHEQAELCLPWVSGTHHTCTDDVYGTDTDTPDKIPLTTILPWSKV